MIDPHKLSVLLKKSWFIHAAGGLGLLVVVLATSVLGVRPQLHAAIQSRIQHQQSQELRARLVDLQQQRTELVKRIHALSSSLVEQYSSAGSGDEPLLDLLVRLSHEHGLAFMGYTEAPLHRNEVTAGSLTPVSLKTNAQPAASASGQRVQVRLHGTYLQVQQWLEHLTKLPTPIRVQTLQLSAVDPLTDSYQLQAELHVFACPQQLAAIHFD